MAKILEIEFKGGRKTFFANPHEFPFRIGDSVIVEAEKGEGLGTVINLGSLVDQRAGDQTLPQIVRKPNKDDFKHQEENETLETEAFTDCKERIDAHQLDMKLVDVEYQFDRKKITFYFTSENRVDFRALVRDLASRYRTRIELRQIGVRDEAKRIGGMGVCGRKLCCSSFLREFEPVVTQLAKDQNLALNPTKLSGCCGRLMCCLRYESDMYLELKKRFPSIGTKVKTEKGIGDLIKFDIFKEKCTLRYENHEYEVYTLEEVETFLEAAKQQDTRGGNRRSGNKRRFPKRNKPKENRENGENSGGEQPRAEKPSQSRPPRDQKSKDSRRKPGGKQEKKQTDRSKNDRSQNQKSQGEKPKGDKPRGDKPGGDKTKGDEQKSSRSRSRSRGNRSRNRRPRNTQKSDKPKDSKPNENKQ